MAAAESLVLSQFGTQGHHVFSDVRESFRFNVVACERRFCLRPAHLPDQQKRITKPAEISAALPEIRLSEANVGIDFQYFNGDSGKKYLIESIGGGIAVLDYDNDGWPDLYFSQGCRLPAEKVDAGLHDRLYRNIEGKRFVDVTSSARLGHSGYGQGCACGDWNNDGYQDLFVANYRANVMYANNRDGTFSEVPLPADPEIKSNTSAAFTDVDGDGNLDLYIARYVRDALKTCRSPEGDYWTCDPHNYISEPDVLLRSLGDGQWEDVTAASGMVDEHGRGLGVVAADLNNDCRIDFYVANDGSPNFLFENTGMMSDTPQFVDRGVSHGSGLGADGDARAGMGIACAELTGDDLLDLYVTNFYLEPNTFYVNQGDMLFTDDTRRGRLFEPTLRLLGFARRHWTLT